MEDIMQTIQAILNNLSAKEILEIIKEKNTKALFVGSSNPNDESLEEKLQNPNISYEELLNYAFIHTDVRSAYFDEEGCLAFEVNLEYEFSSNNTIYALCIVSDESIFIIAPTPKIKKLKGIGGTFILKTSIQGSSGDMVFKADSYISEAEFEPFRTFTLNFQSLLEAFEFEARKKMLLLDLENYLDTQIITIKQDLDKKNKIGEKSYFYRNSLPSDYVEMGSCLKRDEYPLLWYFTLGCVGNDGGEYFYIPIGGAYSKGAENIGDVGVFKQSGLPNIAGDLKGGGDNLSGDGVFRNTGNATWTWSGGHGWSGPNKVRLDASTSSPIYGRSEDVEVNRVHYLEGIYAGKALG